MAEEDVFDSEIGRIDGVLKAMREALIPPAAMLAEAAGDVVIPDEAKLAAAEERLNAEAPERQAVEAAMARLVMGLAAGIGTRKAEFDNREQPARLEKLIGTVSKAAMRRRLEARWRRGGPLGRLAELLRRADLLTGLVRTERDMLLAERKESESHLTAFVDHRPQIIGTLRSGIGGAMTRVEAARHAGRCVTVFQGFVDVLNGRIGTCNVLLHKLMADTEDLLILYQAVSEAAGQSAGEGLTAELFPNAAAGIERFASGMLTIRGLDRRRERADRAFAGRFPTEAAGEAVAEVPPEKPRLRLPAIPRFKLMRS